MTYTTNHSINLIQRFRVFWRKHLRNIWGNIQWPLIAALGLIALVLGYIGFDKYYDVNEIVYSPFDVLYASL